MLPYDDVTWRACHRATGDTGETLQLLAQAAPPRRRSAQRTLFDAAEAADGGDDACLTVLDVADLFGQLAAAPAAAKTRLVETAWRRMSPLEMKYFTKVMTGGMRIGLSETLVEEAVARATGRRVEDVRMANMLSGDIGETALLARHDRLNEAVFRLMHPLGFMLATPIEDPPEDLTPYLVEDKFDGIRAQLHVADGRARLFSRTLDEAREFPEITDAARRIPHELVLDGEVVALRTDGTGTVAPFGQLQRRLGRKQVPETLRREVPVQFIAYDLLYIDGEPLHRKTLQERRATLTALDLPTPHLRTSPAHAAQTREDALAHFEAARQRGNEGLMMKRLDSTYDFGKRGKQWLKLKRALATLDVVVTAAELGHGKRAGLLSDVTFAVRDEHGELYNIGKAFTGLTDIEIRNMTSILKSLTTQRYGSVHVVRPEIVLEIAFDSITQSSRHKSGYALRFPRIVRWRHDKLPHDIDTLDHLHDLWKAHL